MSKEQNKKAAAFFDYDGTLTPYTMVHSYIFMNMVKFKGLKRWLFAVQQLFLALFYLVFDKVNTHRFNYYFFRKYKGMNYKELCKDYEETFEQTFKANLFDEMKEIVHKHKKEGCDIVIISASPDVVIKPIAQYFGADKYYTRILEVKNGKVTGELESNFMKTVDKTAAILDYAEKNNIDLSRSYAYGDSSQDVAMFNLVGNSCLVKGSSKKLRELAREKKWTIINPT